MRTNKNAKLIAGQLMARGINPTFKIIGEALRVAPSNVKRWFEPSVNETFMPNGSTRTANCVRYWLSLESERCARLYVRNGDGPGIVRANQSFGSRAMANKTKLKVRIPFLLEAAAEGDLAIILLFALALVMITLIGVWR